LCDTLDDDPSRADHCPAAGGSSSGAANTVGRVLWLLLLTTIRGDGNGEGNGDGSRGGEECRLKWQPLQRYDR